MTEVFSAVYKEKRQSTVSLIPKKGDLVDLQNWCLIKLLSVEYKIMTNALKQFETHLPSVNAPDQTCSIPGRSINDNLLLVRDLIKHSQEWRSPLGLFSLDQEKALDRVSHGFLQRVLTKMNFPNTLSTGWNYTTRTPQAEFW